MQVQEIATISIKNIAVQKPVYFLFESDFIEQNVRCIPMIVRFKMDAVGIKLALAEWCKFSNEERRSLASFSAGSSLEIVSYYNYLNNLVLKYTSIPAKILLIDENPAWANLQNVPAGLQQKASEFHWVITINKWKSLTNLQRFALLKLFSPGHENKNFPKAMAEFGLI